MDEKRIKTIAQNKKARHEYFIEDTYEAGIALSGTEVKSVRQSKVSLVDAYVEIKEGEAFVTGMHISPYEQGNIFNKDPLRKRKLLLHRREIMKLLGQVKEKGYTLVPLSVYLKGPLVKVQVALARGKKLYDKRASAAERDAKRSIDRRLKEQMQ